MKITPIDPPRTFEVGRDHPIRLKDCARIELSAEEQVTFLTESGGEYDVARKSWGFYATPSLNGRLPRFGLRAALVKSGDERTFILLVERGKELEFQGYLDLQGLRRVCWLDDDRVLETIERCLQQDG